MTTILLYGELADLFGPVWKLNVHSVAEAVRAIEANKPGLFAYFEGCGERGIDFNIKANKEDAVTEDTIRAHRTIDTIQISPVVRGSKNPMVQVIAAIAIIIISIYYPPAAAFLAKIKMGQMTLQTFMAATALSMAISGVAQMIAGTPKAGQIDDGGKQSDLFNGPENTTTQGGPVPLVYGGPILVGSQVISAGIFTEDTTLVTTAYPNGSGGLTSYVDGPFGNPNGAAY